MLAYVGHIWDSKGLNVKEIIDFRIALATGKGEDYFKNQLRSYLNHLRIGLHSMARVKDIEEFNIADKDIDGVIFVWTVAAEAITGNFTLADPMLEVLKKFVNKVSACSGLFKGTPQSCLTDMKNTLRACKLDEV